MDIGGEGSLILDAAGQNDNDPPNNLNISDVLEAISLADPMYGAGAVAEVAMNRQVLQHPTVQIVEQPASKALRFRYECEGRSAGSIPGVNSTPENKTYPTIKILGYEGVVTIMVSCVTKDEPYRSHPHNLVGRERCDRGVCTIKTKITKDANEYQFKNLGIQCVKRRDIAEALQRRADLRVDPFKTGFEHRNQPQSIDLNAVRLAFQVFLPDSQGNMRCPLKTVCSDVIYDKKAMCDLLIMRASHCSGTARGGTQIILLCEKVTREDTAVVFYEEKNQVVVWEQIATTILVHKQVAIAFEAPPYRDPATKDNVNVHFQLKRLTDNARSNSLPFEYFPDTQDPHYVITGKRKKKIMDSVLESAYKAERAFQADQIKAEPLHDRTPPHHMSSPPLNVYSPQYMPEQHWGMGDAHVSYAADGQWQHYQLGHRGANLAPSPSHLAPSPSHLAPSPSHLAPSPSHLAPSPSHLAPSPSHLAPSPSHLGPISPGMAPVSPCMGQEQMGHMSPGMGHVSPAMGHVSPAMGHVSPAMGHISPGMVHSPQMHVQQQQQQHMQHQMHQHQMQQGYSQMPQAQMDAQSSNNPSLSNLLMAEDVQMNTSDLANLSYMLGDRLSTSDLLL